MDDALLARAERAIEASRGLREQQKRLAAQHGVVRDDLRRAIMESAMLRSEVRACRDDREA
jgi:DNA-binding phage protein